MPTEIYVSIVTGYINVKRERDIKGTYLIGGTTVQTQFPA